MVEITRVAVIVALLAGVGATFVLSEMRPFRRASLVDRLAPFTGPGRSNQRLRHANTLGAIVTPLVTRWGGSVARIFGVSGDLASRLERAGSAHDVSTFRLRQFAFSFVGLLVGLVIATSLGVSNVAVVAGAFGGALLTFLVIEQHSVAASQRHQALLFAELPIVSEQLAMLLGAGYSLTAALDRVAERNTGVGSTGLREACERVRHGVSIEQALREWAARERVAELDRLVAVLALSSETSDLGRLVADEGKTTRREAHRRMNEVIDRRAQQVWVPVTVATLIPGVIFLIIPFLQALQLFNGN